MAKPKQQNEQRQQPQQNFVGFEQQQEHERRSGDPASFIPQATEFPPHWIELHQKLAEIEKHESETYNERMGIEEAYATIAKAKKITVAELKRRIEEGEKRTAKDVARLERLERQLAQRLATVALPRDGLKNEKQYAAAAQLTGTFQEIAKLEKKLGLPVRETPQGVKEAQRLRVAFFRRGEQTARAANLG